MNKKQEYSLLIKKLISCENREQLSDTIKEINHFNREYSITSSSEEFKKFEIVIGLMRVKLKHKHGITENKINMNNKTNIFEELNTIKNMFHYQPGKVISEQDNATNIVQMKDQLEAFNTNEDAVVNIIKKLKTKQDFQNFVTQYKTSTGKDFGVGLHKAINPSSDRKEWGDLKTYLATLGVTLDSATTDKGKGVTATFGGITGSVKAPPTQEELNKRESRWTTDLKCVTTQPNAKKLVLKDKTTAYEINGVIYYNAGRKKLANGTMSSYSCSTEFKTKKDRVNSGNNIKNLVPLAQDIQTAIGSNPSGKLSSQELDSILQRLGGNDVSSETSQEVQTTQAFPTDANGKPDLDKILASLAQ
jgi:hypothetical protein